MRKNLVIRADANTGIGSGHLMRCLALAQAWQNCKGKVTFLSHCDSETLCRRIENEGFEFIPIENPHPDPYDLAYTLETLKQLETRNSKLETWLILDGYHFTQDYQKAIRENGYRLIVIDDMAHLDNYFADIILNQNLHADEDMYSTGKSRSRLLLGPRYILLRQEFLKWNGRKREIPDVARKVIITMGGSDPDNVTLKVIRALNLLDDPDLEVKIVVGPANPNIKCIQKELSLSPFIFHILPSVNDMPELMDWADLAVSAGGSTSWEIAFTGLPAIIVVLAENQRNIAESLNIVGTARNLGWHYDLPVEDMADAFTDLAGSSKERYWMSKRGSLLVDGGGSRRVAEILLQHFNFQDETNANIVHG